MSARTMRERQVDEIDEPEGPDHSGCFLYFFFLILISCIFYFIELRNKTNLFYRTQDSYSFENDTNPGGRESSNAMYNLYSSSDSSDGEGSEGRGSTTLDMSGMEMSSDELDERFGRICGPGQRNSRKFKTVLLYHNAIEHMSPRISQFENLKYLDVSSNAMHQLPPEICDCPLETLIAKNNHLNNKSLPPNFPQMEKLRELNLSGNEFTHFPLEVLELKNIKFLYMGGNRIAEIPRDIRRMQSLQILSMGGNLLTEIPSSLGMLTNLTALVLSDNKLKFLPREIARLKKLRSLLLHRNELKTLPTEIIVLKNLTELSLRDNPLVVRFVSDISHSVPTLLELAARMVKLASPDFSEKDLPKSVMKYLDSAHHCVNPRCKGVYFDSRVEHVKFVDFCGKYRIPLMQYLCSSRCVDDKDIITVDEDLLKKVLLG